MADERLEGFVLQHTELSASRSVVTLFTREQGKRQGVWRRSKRDSPAYLATLTKLEFQLTGKEQQSLKRMHEVNLARHVYNLATDYKGLALLQHWAGLLRDSQPEGQEDERVFRLVDHCLHHLSTPDRFLTQNLYFEAWLLHFCGVLPRPPKPDTNMTQRGEGETRIRQALEHPALRRLFHSDIEDWSTNPLEWEALAETTARLGDLWEHFLARELKTRQVLLTQFNERRHS